MTHEHKHTMVCDICGSEADIIIKEDEDSLAEHEHHKPARKVLVCRNCGNEADMILEEVDADD
ncbi:MAG: hypothetical protein R6U37_00845 [Dehalococcoidia bacterium]